VRELTFCSLQLYLIEELVSPFVTPIILYFHLRHKSLDIVDFYRNFTVEVIGVGDVCSFGKCYSIYAVCIIMLHFYRIWNQDWKIEFGFIAQMDVRKHGNPSWQVTSYEMDGSSDQPTNNNNAYTQAENGKTELSLVHFTHTNPEWLPPSSKHMISISSNRQPWQIHHLLYAFLYLFRFRSIYYQFEGESSSRCRRSSNSFRGEPILCFVKLHFFTWEWGETHSTVIFSYNLSHPFGFCYKLSILSVL